MYFFSKKKKFNIELTLKFFGINGMPKLTILIRKNTGFYFNNSIIFHNFLKVF